jgi:two-component system OmpR family sensor kinase
VPQEPTLDQVESAPLAEAAEEALPPPAPNLLAAGARADGAGADRASASGERPRRWPLRTWRRTPLWARLVGAVLLLVAIALVFTGTIASNLLRSYLNDQVDQRLASASTHVDRSVDAFPGTGGSPPTPLPNPVIYELIGNDGTLLGFTQGIGGSDTRAPDLGGLTSAEARRRGTKPYTIETSSGRWRVLLRPVRSDATLATISNLADVDRALNHLERIEWIVGLAVLVALAGLGVVVVRLSLRPLDDIEDTAAAISAGDLSRRVPHVDPRTEVGRLGASLNGMLGQIEAAASAQAASEREARASEDRMRRFVADASHELRTPLTSIRGFAELHRQRGGGTTEETDRLVGRIESEATRMSSLVEDLLVLARMDQGRPLQFAQVDLRPLAHDAGFDLQTLDPDRPVDVVTPDSPVVVSADAGRVRQVLANLIGNVRTHTPGDAATTISVREAGPWAVIEVADRGPGLDPDQAAKVFERFYRADDSRGRSQGGVGLGLSIVASIADAHGGGADVQPTPGGGATFRFWLPRPATTPPPLPRVESHRGGHISRAEGE